VLQELEQAADIYHLILEFFVSYSFQIIGALIILSIGVFLARKVESIVFALCQGKGIDITLSRFSASTVRIIIIIMVAVIALGKVGLSITPFLAAIGALSLGAGLALQGLLTNYSAGLNIILTRPYVVGDTICVQGVAGIVKEVQLAFTILSDEDGVEITIPNKHIVGEIIHNSQEDSLLELIVGIAYHSDPSVAINCIKQSLLNTEGISDHRKPLVGIEQFGDSCINLGIRFWAKTPQLYETRYRANLAIHQSLKNQGIEIPFPQHEVRVLTDS